MFGINSGGFQLTSSIDLAKRSIRKDHGIQNRVEELFGTRGVKAAAIFFRSLRHRIPTQVGEWYQRDGLFRTDWYRSTRKRRMIIY